MKINWGLGITMLYLGFVVMILVLVGMSASQKIDLATEHYYEEELIFQDKIDKTKRAITLAEPLTWEVNEQGLKLHYPKTNDGKNITGIIKLYCPSNDKNDRSFDINPEVNQQLIPAFKIPAGRYKLQIDWKKNGVTYFNEDVVLIGMN
ncbi:FixH family protein [Dyadobacter psychrotolerans]|uniref:Nitrogen fixation protein FixH n=1 Tax=Dyadobacter psychrotolerans TaxID=2541721 RepID=A0A4R5E070_9BACT|nr:FixH family protein [Dyadobacter psychrotolerans]TDE18374.1 hypothetical protein E0F88_02195 [Dyadobacter psychrotolerans]